MYEELPIKGIYGKGAFQHYNRSSVKHSQLPAERTPAPSQRTMSAISASSVTMTTHRVEHSRCEYTYALFHRAVAQMGKESGEEEGRVRWIWIKVVYRRVSAQASPIHISMGLQWCCVLLEQAIGPCVHYVGGGYWSLKRSLTSLEMLPVDPTPGPL